MGHGRPSVAVTLPMPRADRNETRKCEIATGMHALDRWNWRVRLRPGNVGTNAQIPGTRTRAAAEPPPDFADLLGRARQGDKDALTELTRRYEPEVRIVARVLLGPALQPHLDSLDLVQSVHRTLMLGIREDRY